MTTVFLSGSRSISRLAPELRQRLDNIVANGFGVVIGDANGADKAMQKYLASKQYDNVEVFFVGIVARNNCGNWPSRNVEVKGKPSGWEYYAQKDKRMAELADYGLVLWDGESSGSIHNVFELLRSEKKTVVFYNPRKSFVSVNNEDDAVTLLNCASGEVIKAISDKIGISKYLRSAQNKAQTAFCF